jgi:hypothetical protein
MLSLLKIKTIVLSAFDTHMIEPIRALLTSLALFWHLLAFAAGGVYAVLAFRSVFCGGYQPFWTRVLRAADWQLWASGLVIVLLGLWVSGAGYLANPKLQAKLLVVVAWFCSTQMLRRFGRTAAERGRPAYATAAVLNLSCWAYGGFLGAAKPLAQGVAPLSALLLGFVLVTLLGWLWTMRSMHGAAIPRLVAEPKAVPTGAGAANGEAY